MLLGRENTVYQAQYNKLRMFLRFPLYGGIILGGNCTRNNSVWLCYWGREDVFELPCMVMLLEREDVPGTALYSGVIGEGKMY